MLVGWLAVNVFYRPSSLVCHFIGPLCVPVIRVRMRACCVHAPHRPVTHSVHPCVRVHACVSVADKPTLLSLHEEVTSFPWLCRSTLCPGTDEGGLIFAGRTPLFVKGSEVWRSGECWRRCIMEATHVILLRSCIAHFGSRVDGDGVFFPPASFPDSSQNTEGFNMVLQDNGVWMFHRMIALLCRELCI